MKLNREAPVFGGDGEVKKTRKTYKPPTNRQLDIEITKLKGEYRREMDIAQAEITSLKTRLHTTTKVASDANAAIKKRGQLFHRVDVMLDETKAHDALENYSKRTVQIGRKLQIEILKTTVMAEVVRENPELLPGTVSALDELDEWWHHREGFTMREWTKEMRKLTLIKNRKRDRGE